MLKLSKKGVSMSYKVTGPDDAEMALLKGCGAGQTGQIDIARSSLVYAEGSAAGSFTMTKDGAPAASATRTAGRRHFVINQGELVVELNCPFARNKPYDVIVDGQPAGSISLSKFTGRVVTVDLPETIPLEVRLFAGWLTLRGWNSQAEQRID